MPKSIELICTSIVNQKEKLLKNEMGGKQNFFYI